MVGILGFCLKFQVIPNLDSFYIWSTLSKYERIYRLRKNSCNIIEKYKKSVTYREGRREIPSRVAMLGPEAVSSCWRCIRPWSSRRYLIRRPPWLFPLSHVSISIPWNFSLFLSFFFPTKFTACICRDKRPWAWVRWTFAVLLKMVVKENYASRRLKRESVEPFQLFEAIRYSEKEREREGVLVWNCRG